MFIFKIDYGLKIQTIISDDVMLSVHFCTCAFARHILALMSIRYARSYYCHSIEFAHPHPKETMEECTPR